MKAFPLQGMTDINGQKFEAVYELGMDLRDYFAAKAMQALIQMLQTGPVDVARNAYFMADAMMKAREQ